ncbi:hypothetical protein KSP39_PZI018763 [Platanthera zijinensis]|uniref:Uncharacterized protein n=1 Tax=Platanthera zijinensis TaxID=2320716 RepID=A0AAP0B403_9ASPA
MDSSPHLSIRSQGASLWCCRIPATPPPRKMTSRRSARLQTTNKGTTEPSMEEQPRRSARLEIGQSSSGIHTAGTVSLDLE